MPEYLAPGVYLEEVSYRTRSIEGVSTTTAAFVGPTRFGPVNDTPELVTSLNEFELTYGDGRKLAFEDPGAGSVDNWMWHAARAFFGEGGRRLYVQRIFNDDGGRIGGRANEQIGTGANALTVAARHPGAAGDLHVTLTIGAGQNILSKDGETTVARGLSERDVVLVTDFDVTKSPPSRTRVTLATSYIDTASGSRMWRLVDDRESPAFELDVAALDPAQDVVQVVTATLSVAGTGPGATSRVWAGLPLDPEHELGGAPDSLAAVFDPAVGGTTPVVVDLGSNHDGVALFESLATAVADALAHRDELITIGLVALLTGDGPADQRSLDIVLGGGSDGLRPTAADLEGEVDDDDRTSGLVALEAVDDISIVAAPGSTHGYAQREDDADACVNALIGHARRMRYRIAVVDSGDTQTIAAVRAMRAKFDSSHAALYYPWVRIADPLTGQPLAIPPSGAVAGIYARNDVERGVYKAPANEVVSDAIGFERQLSKSQQEVLNPEGINCLRSFPGRGHRLWGARVMSSDPEWKYVNLRRYFAFLERSIDRGTQWAVFEPNGERLWASVRATIEDFLLNQWQTGALLGDRPEKAYFVRCDRSTMTQNDIDNGRIVCQIGVAPLRPAEFVIFRIGQWSADRKL